jgi:hypothetical protein
MHSDLIKRLKQQPRHGQTPPDPDAQQAGISLNDIAKFVSLLSPVVTIGNDAVQSIKELNNAFAKSVGINAAIGYLKQYQTSLSTFLKTATVLEKRNTSLQKNFGITAVAAAKLGTALDAQAKTYGVSGEQARQYAASIGKMLPTLKQSTVANTGFYTGLQQSQAILQTNIGLTDELSNSYTQYAATQGENAIRTLKASKALSDALDPTGEMGYFKMVTEGIATAGSEIQLQYGKIPGKLELAVIKSNKLGLSLEKLSGIGSNLLDIETSIGQELEYQLLSGRRLTNQQGQSLTNLYREATLRGDMNKQADVLNNILEQESETLENNMFARKQMSELLGIEEKQLASAIQKKKIFDKAAAAGITLNIDDEGALAAAAEQLKETGQLTADEFKDFKKSVDTRTSEDILNEILTVQQEMLIINQISNQEKLINLTRDSIIKTQTAFAEKLSRGISDGQAAAAGKAVMAVTAFKTIKDAIPKNAAELKAKGASVTAEQTIGTTSTSENTITPDDAIIPAGYGSRILTFPEDTLQSPIAFNNNDTIVAGTFGNTSSTSTSNSGTNIDMMQFANIIVSAIQQQTQALRDKPGTMNVNRFA